MAISPDGTIVYHWQEEVKNTKLPTDRPHWDIINNGKESTHWISFLPGKGNVSKTVPFRRNTRITKIYGKRILRLDTFIFVESHISIISNISKNLRLNGKEYYWRKDVVEKN